MTQQLEKWAKMLGYQPRLIITIEDWRSQRGGLAAQALGTMTVELESATGERTTTAMHQDFHWGFGQDLPAHVQQDIDGFKAAMDQQYGADQWIYEARNAR